MLPANQDKQNVKGLVKQISPQDDSLRIEQDRTYYLHPIF